MIGDDAQSIFILDKEHVFLDSIHLFSAATKRIDREQKTDLESSIILPQDGKTTSLPLVLSLPQPGIK